MNISVDQVTTDITVDQVTTNVTVEVGAAPTVEVLLNGLQGPAAPLSDFAYTHYQAVALAEWPITHNLGWNPNVTVLDSAGNTVEGDIVYDTTNLLTLKFRAAFAGVAHLS